MRATTRVLVGVLVIGLLFSVSGCGGTTQVAKEAMSAGRAALHEDSSLASLLRRRDALAEVPRKDFSGRDWKVRGSVLGGINKGIKDAEIARVDGFVEQATKRAATSSVVVAAEATTAMANPNPEFLSDLADVFEDGVKSVACGKIFDALVPDERPAVPGESSTAEEAANEAATKLAVTWTPSTFRDIVNWGFYIKSLNDDAAQFVSSIDGYSAKELPNPDAVTLLGRPQVREAAVVYLRTCYEAPRLP